MESVFHLSFFLDRDHGCRPLSAAAILPYDALSSPPGKTATVPQQDSYNWWRKLEQHQRLEQLEKEA